MGASEEAGEVVKSVVSQFGPGNAACLAAIILSAMFALLTFFALQRDADRRSEVTKVILGRCLQEIGEAAKPPLDGQSH
jgi:hypothetical protein